MSAFSEEWKRYDALLQPPARARAVREVPADHFREMVLANDVYFAGELVKSLAAGDVWLIRGLFGRRFMEGLKNAAIGWMHSREPSFHKMLEGSPDFHRIIDLEAGKKYSFRCCKHAAYFYRWNDDPLRCWDTITARWRLAKTVMGLEPDAYERFTPKDGVVDRVQIVRYPPSAGYLEPHQDPHLHQRLFFSGYMSKRGVDYRGGGFYLVGGDNRVMEIEDRIEVGDACIGYATVCHGVAPCDRHKGVDWGKTDGRWFLSMYSNASDEVPQRHTGHPERVELEGVLP